jgi:preflagellin peptidase FlaK
MENLEIVEFAAVIVSIFFFSLGSISDLRTREVDDRVWLVYGPIGLCLTIVRLILDPGTLLVTIASIGVTTFVSLGLGYFGLFGGADAKAIICLGLTLPVNPTYIHSFLGYVHPFFPLVVLIAGFICSASLGIWFGLRNSLTYVKEGHRMFDGLEGESSWKKAMACILGYPAKLSQLRTKFYLYPMEEVAVEDNTFHRSLNLYLSMETDREQVVSELADSLTKLGFEGNVWVTPGIPMLLFILIGLILTLAFGDIVFSTVLILAGR